MPGVDCEYKAFCAVPEAIVEAQTRGDHRQERAGKLALGRPLRIRQRRDRSVKRETEIRRGPGVGAAFVLARYRVEHVAPLRFGSAGGRNEVRAIGSTRAPKEWQSQKLAPFVDVADYEIEASRRGTLDRGAAARAEATAGECRVRALRRVMGVKINGVHELFAKRASAVLSQRRIYDHWT